LAHFFQINHDLKLIAVFSPKCACQSIGFWFLNTLDMEEEPDFRMLSRYRVQPKEISDYNDYLKVLFIRDPLSRLVSFYAQWVIAHDAPWCFADKKARFTLKGRTFRHFIYVLEHLWEHDLPFQHHLLPQTDRIGPTKFDKTVLVNTLSEGLEDLNRHFGITADCRRRNVQSYNTSLQQRGTDRQPAWLKRNGTPSTKWFFDEETTEIAEKIYRDDLALFRSVSDEKTRVNEQP
jgi:hypothetical protein